MWPVLLNMTRDECRQTLRRLELEAYSKIMSVFRAQGALEERRKKLLEELHAILNISNDRHSAEARRVANDELLATIAHQLCGPSTSLSWLCEGRRKVPLLTRGVAQTMFTEIADKAAEVAETENKVQKKRSELEKMILCDEKYYGDDDFESGNEKTNEDIYSPIAMDDPTSELWDTELICRKRKMPQSGDHKPPKNYRNIPVNKNQKHIDLSSLYSKYSQAMTSKLSRHSKHSYNQVNKVSSTKCIQTNMPKVRKPRTPKNPTSKQTQKKKTRTRRKNAAKQVLLTPSKHCSPMQTDYSGRPTSFQDSYAQSVLCTQNRSDFVEDMLNRKNDLTAMQLLSHPVAPAREYANYSTNDHLQAQTATEQTNKPCQFVIKKGNDPAKRKLKVSEVKILQKPADSIKILSNKQIMVAPSSVQKVVSNANNRIATKAVSTTPKPHAVITDKMIVVSKSSEYRTISNPKIVLATSVNNVQCKESATYSNSMSPKVLESITPKGIPATDLKVSAKTLFLNAQSGKKVVVVPSTKQFKTDNHVPLLQIKGTSSTMKLVPVSSQPSASMAKSSAITVLSKPKIENPQTASSKAVCIEPIKTANMADIVPVKGLSPPKLTNPIVRPANTKGNFIVVQKGKTIGKAVTLTKNGNDMSKIIMGKNVNQLLQAKKSEQNEGVKASNVIVLELNNDETCRPTTMSEILDNRNLHASQERSVSQMITQSTPVLFEHQIVNESCNISTLDSTDCIEDFVPLDEPMQILEKKIDSNKEKEPNSAANQTEWEMDMEDVSRSKDVDKSNALNLDLDMSSDSENEYRMANSKQKCDLSILCTVPKDESVETVVENLPIRRLQDDGSSSNESFAFKSKDLDKKNEHKLDKYESDALTKARAKLSEKVADAKSQQKRIDVYSTAISTSVMNLDTFSYLEEGIIVADDVFPHVENRKNIADNSSVESIEGTVGEVSVEENSSVEASNK